METYFVEKIGNYDAEIEATEVIIGVDYHDGDFSYYRVNVSEEEAGGFEYMTSEDLKWYIRLNGATILRDYQP